MSRFEKIVRSNLSSEDVYSIIKDINRVEIEDIYRNDGDLSLGIYRGGFSNSDIIPTGYLMGMEIDDESIYIDFINNIREQLKKDDNFNKAIKKSVFITTYDYFNNTSSDEARDNAALVDYYRRNIEGNNIRKYYLLNNSVSVKDEEMGLVVYPLSKLKGVGDIANSIEKNSLVTNLLRLASFDSYLILGCACSNDYSNLEGFTLYRDDHSNYNLIDTNLGIRSNNVLDSNSELDKGFTFTVIDPKGRDNVLVNYSSGPVSKVKEDNDIIVKSL